MKPIARRVLVTALLPLGFAVTVAAHGGDRGYAVSHPAYAQECGSCHVPYPPALLAPQAWSRIMHDLGRHFGVDASLDAATAAEISAFLAADAAPARRNTEPQTLRITRTSWFVRKHDDVPRDVWKRPAVGSPANCAACHPDAERGVYGERSVRLPH